MVTLKIYYNKSININLNNTIECPLNILNCTIDCSIYNCNNKIIYSKNILSLNILCNKKYTCNLTTIYCPLNNCNILRNNYKSCLNIIIYELNKNGIININCKYNLLL